MTSQTIPITYGRWKDMAPRHAWRRIKQIAKQNARLAGMTSAEWERRRIEYDGGPKAADLAMPWLPTYDGARCYLGGPAAAASSMG